MRSKVVGLRTATSSEIQELITKLRSQGYFVEHKTEGLPFNGILVCTRSRRQ